MGLLRKLFGKKSATAPEPGATPSTAGGAPAQIQVYDEYGRQVWIDRQQWVDNVLPGNLESARNDPNQLAGLLIGAFQDGFAAEVVPYAEHLQRIDPDATRGATLLGIACLQTGQLDRAQAVLEDFLERHGEVGVVLTNLAKVHSQRGDDAKAEAILWHALEVDPNQDNGLDWYAAIHQERGGEAAALDAYRRVAALPGSWRARLALAGAALESGDLPAACNEYREVLARAGEPVPADALMQMSGELGQHGHLVELLELTRPHFDPEVHGLQLGNNLIKAHLNVGQTVEARAIVDVLYAQQRPDWRETLDYWDTQLAQAGLSAAVPPAHR